MYVCIRTHTHAQKVGHVENIMTSAVDRTAGESIKQKKYATGMHICKKTFISKFKKNVKRDKKTFVNVIKMLPLLSVVQLHA